MLGITIIAACVFKLAYLLQCNKLASDASLLNHRTIVDTTPKTLSGTWLSEGCEIRPGPEYILRHYSFKENGNYRLVQHHYWDDACTSPKWTIISAGQLKMVRDPLHHGALSGFNKPLNITIIPQDTNAGNELEDRVARRCPGQYWRSWRRFEDHVIFTSNIQKAHAGAFSSLQLDGQIQSPNSKHNILNRSGDITCLGSLRHAFNELKLLKVQLRVNSLQATVPVDVQWELLLGDIPSRDNLQNMYMPSAFQVPLLKYVKSGTIQLQEKQYKLQGSCNICSNLLGSERNPPHLLEKPLLPPYVWGDWISQRCEVRPLGLYLTRKFSFFHDLNWIGEHKFYVDQFCTVLKFVLTATGTFTLGSTNLHIKSANDIDFNIDKVSMVIFDRKMLNYLGDGRCGNDVWKVGIPQELTNSCIELGILIPSTQYDIVKIEMNYLGYWLLYLGQADTENLPRVANERPTAFQPPLEKCGDPKIENSIYFDAYSSSVNVTHTVRLLFSSIYFILLSTLLF